MMPQKSKHSETRWKMIFSERSARVPYMQWNGVTIDDKGL